MRQVVVGRVDGTGCEPVFAAASLEIGNERIPCTRGSVVVLLLPDGHSVEVELDGGALLAERVRGRWSDVRTSSLASMFADHAPGDHVHVQLTGSVLRPGDVLAVEGVVLATTLEGQRYREPAGSVPTRMRAEYAAHGGDEAGARAALARCKTDHARPAGAAPRSKEPSARVPSKWIAIALGLLAIAAFSQAVDVSSRKVVSVSWFVAGWQLVVATAIAWSFRYDYLGAFPLGADKQEEGIVAGRAWRNGSAYYALLGITLFAMGLLVETMGHEHVAPQPFVMVALELLTPVVALATWVFKQRQAMRCLRLVAKAPLLVPPVADGAWGRIDGTLAGPPGSARVDVLVTRSTISRADWLEGFVSLPPELQTLAEGKRIGVSTQDAIVLATPVWGPVAEFWTSPHYRATVYADAGDPVAVLGRAGVTADGLLHFRATGPESLLIVLGDPRRQLARLRRPIWVFLALMPLIVASYYTFVSNR